MRCKLAVVTHDAGLELRRVMQQVGRAGMDSHGAGGEVVHCRLEQQPTLQPCWWQNV